MSIDSVEHSKVITESEFSRQYSALLNDEYEASRHSKPDIFEQDQARIDHLKKEFPDHFAALAIIMNHDALVND